MPPRSLKTVDLYDLDAKLERQIPGGDARRLCKRGRAEIVLDAGEIVGVIRIAKTVKADPEDTARRCLGMTQSSVRKMAGGSSQHFMQPLQSGKVFALKGVLGSK